MIRTAIVLTSALILTACGGREPLQPAQGEGMPVAPAMAQTEPTTDDLLEPSTQQRPERVDELLRRSEEREDDPFDLPPPG
ncbi:hypothetical protein HFP51_10715 [Parasphingopyxis sp. CP4]|uniref:hypothetical protein n=1 Tax=Parasphingopyxis sp. CP4 TaxID=2724527 RepID=UPI0015A4B4F3|nr:hypothetical protein [Parasphingopyxis sp. CP4]QLC22606.1 hypothetical protein HFP51_10715 [Parasphingopyxis sp. CP4]